MNWNRNPPPGVNPQFSSFNTQTNTFQPPTNQTNFRDAPHHAGKPGGGWDEGEEDLRINRPTQKVQVNTQYSRPNPDIVQVNPVNNNPVPSYQPYIEERAPPAQTKSNIVTSLQPGPYERKLVEDICTPGGARVRPSEKDLADFSQKCRYLACEIIGNLLLKQLENPPMGLKAIYVLDKLVVDYPSYMEFVMQNYSRIESAGQSPGHVRAIQTLFGKLNPTSSQPYVASNTQNLENILEF